jgi:hypothetical protein
MKNNLSFFSLNRIFALSLQPDNNNNKNQLYEKNLLCLNDGHTRFDE